MGEQQWLPLESNPEVLTHYSASLGLLAHTYTFQDVLAFDAWAVDMIAAPVRAAVFLFPLPTEPELFNRVAQSAAPAPGEEADHQLFFTTQTVGNACGTVALLHALGNNPDMCEVDSFVRRFAEQTKSMTAGERGVFLEKNTEIASLHAAAETAGQSRPADEQDPECDLHFVVFVEKNRKVFCLDGRKDAPNLCGEVEEDGNFLLTVAEFVKQNFAQEHPDELRFSLLALAPAPTE